ncbi:MAG: hypothetical protein H8E98_06205 [Bacteroidetes bacterium]|nr:hypothetical protein [Bacteroidota bacterium]
MKLKNLIIEALPSSITDKYSLNDWRDYLSKLGLKPLHIKITQNGFEATISDGSKNKPNLSDFTQVKGNWARLSFKDINNKKITKGRYIFGERISEETGLTKQFDKIASEYKELLVRQDKIKKEYLSKSPEQKTKSKDTYIKSIKKINDAIKKAEIKLNKAILNLRIPAEDELL